MLDSQCLAKAFKDLQYTPNIDLFASSLNRQFTNDVSYRPDPQALSIDAFSLTWADKINVLCIFAVQCYRECAKENQRRQSKGSLCVTKLANATVVS